MPKKIDRLIINSPYEEPRKYWEYRPESKDFILTEGRRPAGYVIASNMSQSYDDPGIPVRIPLVNQIRPRVKKWREDGYPGVTGITKRLLEHWYDLEEHDKNRRLFFCQLEAIETLIWLVESPEGDRVGIDIPSDGGEFRRICSKMATGSGKTVVMAMLIAWQIINKITYPQDQRFSRYVLAIAPGLTVKSRLRVLIPSSVGNYYDEFNIVPGGLIEKLRQGRISIINWHMLGWETEEQLAKKHTVDRRGPMSDEAYSIAVLQELAKGKNLVVINDEAHHAWRLNPAARDKYVRQRDLKDSAEEATVWISGLDRIHKTRGILNCYDFTATPFYPSGEKSGEELLYNWIVSDFGLNDAIESGLVKTPRVVIRDNTWSRWDYMSRLYHIYTDPEVKDDLNRKAEEHEPLPELVKQAYYLLGIDWLATAKKWDADDIRTPPVMITVANRVETAARIKYSFDHKKINIDELCDPKKTLHIDSKVLKEAEEKEETGSKILNDEEGNEDEEPKLSKGERAEKLRQQVDTVGKIGMPGEQIQNVISVGMLSEGWDAKTVTQIMGLRAFTSQLLCEQVVGRGLRRTSYEVEKDGLFRPEYVNIFGVPFTFLPHESKDGPPPPPAPPNKRIEPLTERKEFELSWPNVIRVNHVYRPTLSLDISKIKPLELDASKIPTLADMAPILDGKPDISKITTINIEELGKKYRLQRIIFETALEVYEQMQPTWKADKNFLMVQLIPLIEKFISSDRIIFYPVLFKEDEIRRRVLMTLSMNRIVQHIWEAIRFENTESIEPIFDSDHPIKSTGDMTPWFTSKACEPTKKSHINLCVFDSQMEASEAYELDRNELVEAWAKNDHLGLEILYVWEGAVHKYRPDFIIRLKGGANLILETKGEDTLKDKTKRNFLAEWVDAINRHCGFGKWAWAVSFSPADVPDKLKIAYQESK
jgi:type III restriction enzyme